MSNVAISLKTVSKIYDAGSRTVTALQEVSLDIYHGEMLGVLGPSGSGKTTFLMLAGLVEPPTRGEIWFDGLRAADPTTGVRELRTLRRQNIGFVFQKSHLLPFLTALENVQLPLHVNGTRKAEARRRAYELLAELGLEDRVDMHPHTLSGGEQQRVSLARALSNRPSLLLADEPTSALDGPRRQQIMEMLSNLSRKEGVTVCVVTHDVRSNGFFDRIVELSDGEIVRRT